MANAQTNWYTITAIAKPTIDNTVSSTVQGFKVSLTDMLKYLEMIQKPPSFTWLAMIEPEEIATTIRASSGWEKPEARLGARIPPVVTIATVAEPWAMRR